MLETRPVSSLLDATRRTCENALLSHTETHASRIPQQPSTATCSWWCPRCTMTSSPPDEATDDRREPLRQWTNDKGVGTYRIANFRGFRVKAGQSRKQSRKQIAAPTLHPAKISIRSQRLTRDARYDQHIFCPRQTYRIAPSP